MFWRRSRSDHFADICSLNGMTVVGAVGARCVQFSSTVQFDDVVRLLALLRCKNAAIAIYDPDYPSMSDPGAYVDYTLEKADSGYWSMTLGNHGWSGGIYQIDDETIAVQVFDLYNNGHLPQLSIETGRIFSHYERESDEKNLEMVLRIRGIHGKAE